MSLSLGVLHTRLIPISFGYPYVSRQLVALACPQRRRQSALLSLVDARLSGVVSPPPRAHPALSSPQDASQLDASLLSRSDGPWCHRHLWDRVDPPHARRPQPPADRPQRPLQSPLDCWRETLSAVKPVWPGGGVGLWHRQCRR